MYTPFTWFPKITQVADKITDETARMKFISAVIDFGSKGIEPELEFPLDAIFEGVREDIINSRNSRTNNKGGRKKKDTQNQPEETQETGVSEDENGSSETEKPPVSETENEGFTTVETGGFDIEKPPVSESGNGGFQETETHTKPYQAIPNQSNTNQSKSNQRGRAAFKPPSPTEVAEYANEKGIDIDSEYFCDFYQSKGWKVGKDTMKDWKAAVRTWARRDNPKPKPKGGGKYAKYD